jgi:serine/threonine-protein kinase
VEGSSAELHIPREETRSEADPVRGDSTLDVPMQPAFHQHVPSDSETSIDANGKPRRQPAGKPTAEPGSMFGDFRIEELIGEGSMGEVYRATQLSLNRTVALKVLPGEYTENSTLVIRFLREMRSMSELDHPNILKVYATGLQADRYYAALEYIDGSSLQDCLQQEAALEIGDALHITLVCAHALQHAHDRGIVHRDIKPANILLSANGTSKIADFGLVKMTEPQDVSMTGSGTGLGTPEYMPPEQAFDARNADPRSDIYSLGIMLYVMLTRELPFKGKSTVEYLSLKQRGNFKPSRQINSEVPERVDLVLQKMLQAEPSHRYADCAELIKDLGSIKRQNETLSFVDVPESQRFIAYGPWLTEKHEDKSPKKTPPPQSKKQSTTAKAGGSSGAVEKVWYVAHKNKLGKSVLSKMGTTELIRAVKNRLLPVSAQVKPSPNERFRTLTDHEEFLPVLAELGVKIQKRAAKSAPGQRNSGKKRRRKKKSEGLDLFIKIVTGVAATYGIIRGSIDIFSLFK